MDGFPMTQDLHNLLGLRRKAQIKSLLYLLCTDIDCESERETRIFQCMELCSYT